MKAQHVSAGSGTKTKTESRRDDTEDVQEYHSAGINVVPLGLWNYNRQPSTYVLGFHMSRLRRLP
jgi:hypothetical protein